MSDPRTAITPLSGLNAIRVAPLVPGRWPGLRYLAPLGLHATITFPLGSNRSQLVFTQALKGSNGRPLQGRHLLLALAFRRFHLRLLTVFPFGERGLTIFCACFVVRTAANLDGIGVNPAATYKFIEHTY